MTSLCLLIFHTHACVDQWILFLLVLELRCKNIDSKKIFYESFWGRPERNSRAARRDSRDHHTVVRQLLTKMKLPFIFPLLFAVFWVTGKVKQFECCAAGCFCESSPRVRFLKDLNLESLKLLFWLEMDSFKLLS